MTKKITQLNRDLVRILSDEIIIALARLSNKYDIEIDFGGGSFTTKNATIKLDIKTKGADGKVVNKEAEAFEWAATRYGLKTTDLNQHFMAGTTVYKIIGCAPRRSKYPIIAERQSDGKRFKFSAATVVNGLSHNIKVGQR